MMHRKYVRLTYKYRNIITNIKLINTISIQPITTLFIFVLRLYKDTTLK